VNFYRHQQREERARALLALRAGFQRDRDRVAAMKAARTFKPF
jgi:hypothetical protein